MAPSPDSTRPSHSVDSLLDHSEWLQALARRLVRDENSAQDLVQRVWLTALRRPPEKRESSARGWLATVLRNEARMERRTDARRLDRETENVRSRPRDGAPAPEEELVQLEERFELQMQLMAAVRALKPPLRSVMLLRYFEQQPLAAIAERTGTPVRTIEAQLRRGREVLRGRLDGHFGDRSTWAALVLPLALPPALPPSASTLRPSTTILSTATTIMGTKAFYAAIATVAALLIGAYLVKASDPSTSVGVPEPITKNDSTMKDAQAPGPELASVQSTDARVADPVVASAAASAAAPEAALVRRTIRGIAFRGDGSPFPELDLRLTPPLADVESVKTSDSGEFQFEAELPDDASARISPESGDLVVLASREITSDLLASDLPGFIALNPACSVSGVVHSEVGDPVAGASLTINLPENFAARFNDAFWRVDQKDWEATSAADGKFAFPVAPALKGCELTVEAEGYQTTTLIVSLEPDTEVRSEVLEVTLERLDPRSRVSGRVLNPRGEPVDHASVGLGNAMQVTGEDGRFEFRIDDDEHAATGPRRLIAAAEGWCPVKFEPRLDEEGAPVWPASIELRVVRKALSISGVIHDASGSPKGGVAVWIEDPTLIGLQGISPITAEGLSDDQGRLWQRHLSDNEGRFTIPGLAEREYRVSAADLRTMHLSEPAQIQAGTHDVVIQLDPSVPTGRVAGRVVDARGEGLAGASIKLRRVVLMVSKPGTGSASMEYGQTEETLTDKDGSFDLGTLPLHPGTQLYLFKSGYTLREQLLTDLPQPLDQTEITLGSRCRARIVAGNSLAKVPTSARLRSADGEELQVITARANGSSFSVFIPLTDGASKTFEVSSAAVEAVLYAGGEIVATLPLRLQPEGVNEIVP